MTGDAAMAERKLGESEELAEQVASQSVEPWTYWWSPQVSQCQRGISLGYLAHIDRYRVQAIEALTEGYAGLGPGVARSEWAADYLVHRAAIHVRGGDVAEACADARQVVPVARQTSSASLRGMLGQLHAQMAVRWPGDARVAELADALR